MNVLSLFDGMSCGRIALDRAGLPVTNYYASEIDKYAIQVSKANWPDIEHVGDVTKLESWYFPKIDLLIGGSPCQDLRPGRDGLLGPKSKLFYEYLRLKKQYPHALYFFENTYKMKKTDKYTISELFGRQPIEINSALVSAQNRIRLYWTNIPYLGLPDDKGIVLQDVIEKEVDAKYNCTEKFIARFNRRHAAYKGLVNPLKTGTLNQNNNSSRGCIDNGTTVIAHSTHSRCAKGRGGKGPLYKSTGKSYCLDSSIGTLLQYNNIFRRLTPLECERLQTVPDGYTNQVSDTQAYKMLGNGWNVDTIVHLFQGLKCDWF